MERGTKRPKNLKKMGHSKTGSKMNKMKTEKKELTDRLFNGMCKKGDITFLVGPKRKEIKASSFILSVSSPYFERKLEDVPDTQIVIKLPKIDPEIFKTFLQLLVTEDLNWHDIDDLNFSVEDVFGLLHLTKSYEVKFLQSVIRRFIKMDILRGDSAHILSVFDHAREFLEEQLEDKALSVIARKAKKVFSSVAFLSVSRECLFEILQSDDLDISEKDVFNAVYDWAVERCAEKKIEVSGKNVRQIFGHLLFLIRFKLMSPYHFEKYIIPTEILKHEEVMEIYDSINYSCKKKKKPSLDDVDKKDKKVSFATNRTFSNIPRVGSSSRTCHCCYCRSSRRHTSQRDSTPNCCIC